MNLVTQKEVYPDVFYVMKTLHIEDHQSVKLVETNENWELVNVLEKGETVLKVHMASMIHKHSVLIVQ